MLIDVHCHFAPRAIFEGLDAFQIVPDRAGPDRLVSDGRVRGALVPELTELPLLIEDMDRKGVDVRAILTASWLMGYWLDADIGERFARATNDHLAEAVARHPDRLVGLAVVPLQAPDRAVKELVRAVEQLGMRGVAVGTNVNGRYFDDPALFPFLEAVQDLGVPIFFHPDNVAGADRVQNYYLQLMLANPHEATISLAHLVFGGVLERLPRLRPCVTMGGGSLTSLLGRMEHTWRTRPEASANTPLPPSSYLQRCYFDAICHSPETLEILLRRVPASQVVTGTDYPWDMGEPEPGQSVRQLPGLSAADRAAILGANAARLLGLSLPVRA